MVSIIGGGIAGTVLAGALARDHHPVTVYESQPTVGTGAFLVLDGRAHDALAGLGVGIDLLDDVSYPLRALRVDYAPDTARTRPSSGHRLYFRSDLLRVLTEFATDTTADIRYGSPITEVDPTGPTLYSGTTAITPDDLIVAADGIDSVARTRLEPDRVPEYAGQIVIYGITRGPVRLTSDESVLHFQGRVGDGVLPDSTFGHLWNTHIAVWFTRITRPPLPMQDTGFQPVERWAEAIRAAAPAIPDLVDTLLSNTDTVHVSNSRDVPLTDARPAQPPLILCGDADHAITPAAGVGARDAIEDAAAIHHAIVTDRSPAQAMSVRRHQITTEREQIAQRYNRARS